MVNCVLLHLELVVPVEMHRPDEALVDLDVEVLDRSSTLEATRLAVPDGVLGEEVCDANGVASIGAPVVLDNQIEDCCPVF